MRLRDEKRVQQCARATAELTTILATAGTLCIYEGAEAIRPGINLIVEAAAAGEMPAIYENLIKDLPQEDMYNVSVAEPIQLNLPSTNIQFERVLQQFSHHLLTLRLALSDLYLSYARYQAATKTIQTFTDPTDPVHQDARFFQVFQRQAIWQHLSLCAHMHDKILENASRINLHWRQYQQKLTNQETFTSDEISETLNTAWKEHQQDIKAYNLMAFGVKGLESALQIIKQQGPITRPLLLVEKSYHQSLQQLMLSYQQTMDTFYDEQ